MGNALITRRGGGALNDTFATDRTLKTGADPDTYWLGPGETITVRYNIDGSFTALRTDVCAVDWAAVWFGAGMDYFAVLAFWGKKHRTVYEGVLDIEAEIVESQYGFIEFQATITNLDDSGVYIPDDGERVSCVGAVRKIEVGE